jgi:hypothetical protein
MATEMLVTPTTSVAPDGYEPRGGKPARWSARTVLAWASVFAVSLLVLEVTCRIEDWVAYRSPLISSFTSLDDLVIRDADGMHGRPRARYQKWIMNAYGMRGPDISPTPAPGVVRIVTVGASETFGLMESENKEFPRQLEDSLAARAPSTCSARATRFEVVNAAFAGMSLPTIQQDLANRVRRLEPAIVLVYAAPAQYLEERAPVSARPDSSPSAGELPQWAGLKPRVLARGRNQVKLLLPEWIKTLMRASQTRSAVNAHEAGWRFTTLPAERLQQFEADLRRLLGTIHEIGARAVLVTHANVFLGSRERDGALMTSWEKFYPRASGDILVAFDSAAREITLKVGRDSAVTTVDAARYLEGGGPEVFGDFVHFTDLGAGRMAHLLADSVSSAVTRDNCGAPRGTATPEQR